MRIGKQERQSNNTTSQVFAWMIIISRKRNLNQLENSEVCSPIVLKCSHSTRSGRPDVLWSMNKLARSVTKWTGAFAERFARLNSYIHHPSDYRQHCHVGSTARHSAGFISGLGFRWWRWGLRINVGGNLVYLWKLSICSLQFWMCKKQTPAISNHFSGCWITCGWVTCS